MGEFSAIHWFVLTVILLLFGGRKIREMMRHLGNGHVADLQRIRFL